MKLSSGIEELFVNGWVIMIIFTSMSIVHYFYIDDKILVYVVIMISITVCWFIGFYFYVRQLTCEELK